MKTKRNQPFFSSTLGKLLAGTILTLALLIPMNMVENLILERKMYHNDVSNEISRDWGGSQILRGPFLEVPYSYTYEIGTKKHPKSAILTGTAVFLPEELGIKGNITPDYKHRGIYQFIVYDGKFEISGRYKKPDLSHLMSKYRLLRDRDMKWDKAQLKFYISEIKGLTNNLKINWNNSDYEVVPDIQYSSNGSNYNNLSVEGFSCDVAFDTEKENVFKFDLEFKGSGDVGFIPLGKYTEIDIEAPWGSPKFIGNYLPNERNIDEKHFDAHWTISQLNRPIKQEWLKVNAPPLNDYSFGVEFLEPVDKYQKSLRAAKYSILFILLTFISLFFVELFTKREGNVLQYLLTGLALILFYSILLSLTEQMSFDLAYLLSSVSIIGLITVYTYSISKDVKSTFVLFALWSILYGFLFSILQLEELALLAGNIGLFVILAVIMFTSKKLNFSFKKNDTLPPSIPESNRGDNGDLL